MQIKDWEKYIINPTIFEKHFNDKVKSNNAYKDYDNYSNGESRFGMTYDVIGVPVDKEFKVAKAQVPNLFLVRF